MDLLAGAHDIILSGTLNKAMNKLKAQLESILLRHEGQASAIKSKELCFLLGLPDRQVRLLIRELRKDGLPVLSSGEGYFMPSNWDELRECLASMRGRLIADALTRRDIKIYGERYLTPAEQGRLN